MSLATHSQVFDALFESVHVQVAVLDAALAFVRVNHAYASACARTCESFVGRGHFELFPHAENEALFRETLRRGTPLRVRAKPFAHPDQPWRPVSYWDWTLTPITGPDGTSIGLVFQLVDVTDHVVVEKLADERQLLLREIHHRVKNNIQLVATFLREVSYSHPEARTTVDRALGRVGAIARIHETLTVGRDFASVDLLRYATSIVTEVERLHERPEITIVVTGEAKAPVDVASPIGMILQELLGNALEHAFELGATGRIDVSVECADEHYLIEVCDDGTFQPATRESSQGLELVHGLAAQLGGTFASHALTPRGTCCHLRVPIPRSAREG